MSQILFISDTDLKAETVIQKNCQADLLLPFIPLSQELYILRILGQAQYDNLVLDIEINTLTGISTSNAALLNKVKRPLCYCVFYESLPFHWAKISNKGIEVKNSDDSNSVSMVEMEKLRTQVRNWMEFYIEEFKRWLRNNKNAYPLWREEVFRKDDLMSGATLSTKLKYFSGIQFDQLPSRFEGGFYNANDIT